MAAYWGRAAPGINWGHWGSTQASRDQSGACSAGSLRQRKLLAGKSLMLPLGSGRFQSNQIPRKPVHKTEQGGAAGGEATFPGWASAALESRTCDFQQWESCGGDLSVTCRALGPGSLLGGVKGTQAATRSQGHALPASAPHTCLGGRGQLASFTPSSRESQGRAGIQLASHDALCSRTHTPGV